MGYRRVGGQVLRLVCGCSHLKLPYIIAEIGLGNSAAVSDLLALGGPPTVARFVVPVVVDAVDAQPSGFLAHVSQERSEGIAPAFADGNPAPSVVPVVVGTRVCTTFDHPTPSDERPTRGPASRVTVNRAARPRYLRPFTPARGSRARSQVRGTNPLLATAVALCGPLNVTTAASVKASNHQPSEASARQVLSSHGTNIARVIA